MKFYRFREEDGKKISAYQSNFMMSRIMKTEEATNIGCMYLKENGVIGYHQAVTPQLLIIVQGEGEVRGDSDDYFQVKPGDAVFWEKDEWHETKSEKGLTAIVIECESLNPALFMPRAAKEKKMTVTNAEEYHDPILYDKENESYAPELPFLLKWASKSNGPIIDLACGTGRITIPLAKNGYELVGVDIHNGMLEEALKKAGNLKVPIKWVEQDCAKLELDLKSSLLYSVGNSFQHFLTNEAQDGFLSSVNKHLEMSGIFIFGTRFPSAEELLQPNTEEYWRTYIDSDSLQKVDMYTISQYDSLNQIQHYTTIRKYRNKDGKIVDEKRTNISLRYVFPKEMERLLIAHGFEIVHVFSDWKETPISQNSYEMVYVCRKAKSILGGINNGHKRD